VLSIIKIKSNLDLPLKIKQRG